MIPTPLEAFGLSPSPKSRVEIFLKRDDLTGCELSGNKVRKLEFIVYDAISRRADTLITCGGIGSNHCRATAALASRLGLGCHLFLKGRQPSRPNGNLLLDNLYGARITCVTDKAYETNIDKIMADWADRLKRTGKRPYVIPEGASNPLGMWGYLLQGIELKKQLDKANVKPDFLVCAVGSGGTYAGLHLAAQYLDWPVQILGMAVARNRRYFIDKISRLLIDFAAQYDFPVNVQNRMINIDDSYIGPGYAKISKKETDFIKAVAANSGVVLDPAYTAKAMIGLFDYITNGEIRNDSKVVFIHTGGLLSIFSYQSKLAAR
ncbi:MAG: D-cysteine desulfhydrase family protein [candidate division Zixibacteria bacterium]|nr:D-cysteine desulfhydrase family protein [candidate division Zixibacteria bacterium]